MQLYKYLEQILLLVATMSTVSVMAQDEAQFAQRVLDLCNERRVASGIPPLCLNDKLNSAADTYASVMSSTGHYDHTGLDGSSISSRISGAGFKWNAIAENIHKAQKTPEDVFNDWIKSPGHRQNIDNAKYKYMGFGYCSGYWVQVFASCPGEQEQCSSGYAPSQSAPSGDAPSEGSASSGDAPAYEAPAEQAPAPEPRTWNAPAYEAPVANEPSYEAPVQDTPAPNAPAYQEPTANAPAYTPQSSTPTPATKPAKSNPQAAPQSNPSPPPTKSKPSSDSNVDKSHGSYINSLLSGAMDMFRVKSPLAGAQASASASGQSPKSTAPQQNPITQGLGKVSSLLDCDKRKGTGKGGIPFMSGLGNLLG
ncbi:hypothetical protein MIR68_010749 [Amoeboaphelidium protococcarum]|nr:hypothetical protein MIR68_010749 [Amoeboaphelidium protococcarum]